jgi:hypothetical protein
MTFRGYIILMLLATIGAWAAWLVVLVSIDPSKAGFLGYLFFYSTLGMALLGSLSVIGAGIRIWFRREELIARHVWKSFRQAILLSALIIVSLLLMPAGLFSWWTGLLLILMLALIELAWMSSKRSIERDSE